MGFASDYRTIVSVKGSAKINKLLRAGQFYNNYYKAIDFSLDFAEMGNSKMIYSIPLNPPTKPSSMFFADLQVHFIEKSKLFENSAPEKPFAICFMVRPQKYIDYEKYMYSMEQDYNHELLHLDDLIENFDKDPLFLSRGYNYSFNSLRRAGKRNIVSLAHCIDYEFDKLFRLEPKALSIDYEELDRGIIYIPVPEESQLITYNSPTCKEYIQAKIVFQTTYLKSDLIAFSRSFDAIEAIESVTIEAVNRYGKDIFGDNPYKLYETIAGLFSPILYKDIKRNIQNLEARVLNSKYTPDFNLMWK